MIIPKPTRTMRGEVIFCSIERKCYWFWNDKRAKYDKLIIYCYACVCKYVLHRTSSIIVLYEVDITRQGDSTMLRVFFRALYTLQVRSRSAESSLRIHDTSIKLDLRLMRKSVLVGTYVQRYSRTNVPKEFPVGWINQSNRSYAIINWK